jgi:uncharacterized protein YqjF (DUF2071 family)
MQASIERPAARFLTATWQALAMLNYEVDPAVLAPWVPAGTELDTWEGRAFVSMVGFRFTDTRVYRVAVPFHVNFEEVNLRFYVRRLAGDDWRRGVVFAKEIVPRRAIAWLARAAYAERYVAMPMRHDVVLPDDAGTTTGHAVYAWRWRGEWQRLAVEVSGPPRVPAPGSEEAFITEHYWGYARQPDGSTVEYRVEHPPWRVWTATAASLTCDAATLYGPELAGALGRSPRSAFLADGSPIVVRRGVPLCGAGAAR